MTRILFILLTTLLPIVAFAQEYTPETLPFDPRSFVCDPAHELSGQEAAQINSTLKGIKDKYTVAIVAVIVPSTGDMAPAEFATELFNKWKPGADNKDNGAIILVALEQHRAFIATGYGLEGVFTDALCTRILNKYFVPEMKKGRLYDGLNATVGAMSNIIADPANAEELRSDTPYGDGRPMEAPLSSYQFWQIVFWVASMIFIVSAIIFFVDLFSTRRKTNFEKATVWKKHLPIFWLCAAFSIGSGLIFALLALIFRNYYRNKRVRCDTCGHKMNKLSEEKDNEMLNAAQDLEERLNTIDYDVWVCPQCGTIERFPFPTAQKVYSKCPKCHTVARRIVVDKTLIPATTRRAGEGERVYRCEYCHDESHIRYKIPRKENNAAGAAVLGGIAAGSMGRGGGGGFSGPFGGGMSGGGGGGASW